MIHEETKIADLRGIVDLRPVKGADDEYAKTSGEPNEKDGAEDCLNFGCMAYRKIAGRGVHDGTFD